MQTQELTHGERRCGACRQDPPRFAKALCYGAYDGGLRELIQLLKYDRVRPAASVLGRMMSEAVMSLSEDFGEEPPVVIPVPLHRRKERQRGFNQSELIARAALKDFRVPAVAEVGGRAADRELRIAADVLARVRETQSQTGLSRAQRRANLRGAFKVLRPESVAGRDVLLMDDVFTTGATVSECARVLLRAGAARVLVATVARALKAEVSFPPMPEESEPAQAMAVHAEAR